MSVTLDGTAGEGEATRKTPGFIWICGVPGCMSTLTRPQSPSEVLTSSVAVIVMSTCENSGEVEHSHRFQRLLMPAGSYT